MTIIEQLEAIFNCPAETQVDGDGIFNGDGRLKQPIKNMKAGESFSSYFYDPYTGSLKIYGGLEKYEDGRERPCIITEVQATLTFN